MPSEKVLKEKQEIVHDISEKLSTSKGIIFADYRGLSVEQDTELRKALRKAGVNYRVVKNTLTRIAANNIGLAELEPFLKGPTAMAFSQDDPVIPAKIMNEYANKYENLKLKAGVVEGKIIGVDQIKSLADLPSKDVLIAQVLGGMKAPITGLVNVLNANIRGLVIALNAIAEKKEKAEA